MSSDSGMSLVLVSNWKEDTSLPRTGGHSVLPVAATCSRRLEPQSSFLTPGLPQSLTHGATDHWATTVPGTWVWLMRGRLKVGLGKGSWSGCSTESSSVLAGHQPEPEEGNLWLWGGSCKLCLVPDFENTQMLVYKSEDCLGAISVPSLIQTVLSVSTRDHGFTVSLLSGSP